ncbi:hypothetical protein Cni_G29018 [Canna indica]|uniref:Chalcone--flavanone isomerase n=1 Tax=Canna indica TaxID=4628 RepID=A0AAQ3L4F2_9LILI|nr:hypothetical protein Cni_G29018 [Canna indica]
MKRNSVFASMDLNDGQNLTREFQLSQDIGLAILSKFSSLMDSSIYHSRQICTSGSLPLQETFNLMSKFAGSVSVWLFSRPNFNLLHKVSADLLGPNSISSQSFAQIKYIQSLRQNFAGMHFVFAPDSDHAIKAYLTKLASSTIRFLSKEVQLPNGLPILSLAGALVPSFDNASSKALASSITFESASAEISACIDQPHRDPCYHGCATVTPQSIGWKGDAVEPKTGIKFPAFLEDGFSFTNKVLVGIGSRSMKIISLKSLKLYAFGLYVHPDSICQKLGSKYASVPVQELKNNSDFFEDFLREDIHMTIRLVVNCKGLKITTVRDAFEKSLHARLQKMNPHTDYHCLRVFGSYFTQDIALPVGTTIDFKQTADGRLITEIGGKQVGAVHSKDLCRAFFDMYIGDIPVSVQAKEEIAENVAGLIRRC